jgi:Mrp family chromosome partitioning ATPase
VPIIVGDQVIGVIALENLEREDAFSDADARVLSTIAANMGVVMENARLYAETLSQRQHFEAVVQSSPVAIVPAETRTGIRVMSINLLLDSEDQAVIWRGPLISGVIRQFWSDVLWGELDYLVVDLPPGTSDASLTVLQSLPMSGVVLVTSPQDLAGMVVRKAAQMVGQVGVPILGLLENMSYFVCPDTGRRHEIFGPSHPELMAARLGVPLLGRLPIDPMIAALCDRGEIEYYAGDVFRTIAERLVELTPAASAPVMSRT